MWVLPPLDSRCLLILTIPRVAARVSCNATLIASPLGAHCVRREVAVTSRCFLWAGDGPRVSRAVELYALQLRVARSSDARDSVRARGHRHGSCYF